MYILFKLAPNLRRMIRITIIVILTISLPPLYNQIQNTKTTNRLSIFFQLRLENYVLFDDAKPGDVAIATSFKVKYPTYVEDKIIHKNYPVFRVINNVCYLEGDRLDVTERLEVQWMAVEGLQVWNMNPTQNDDVVVILKANEMELKNMNDFVANVVRKKIFFSKSDDWLAYILK